MRYIATGQEVFRIDEFATNVIGIPQLVLMERAALRIAEHVKERFSAGAHVLIVEITAAMESQPDEFL